MMSILDKRVHYKPFMFPWAYQSWKEQQQLHWLESEVPMAEDKIDWDNNMTAEEKNLATQILRFFTQGDLDVAEGYTDVFIPALGGHPELKMMMLSFANMETIHVSAYALLLDTLGMPEAEYKAFKEYAEMAAKHSYLEEFKLVPKDDPDYIKKLAKALAVYSAFTEGLQLFSSFAILMNFPRQGKLRGVGQIVTFSIRDESLHVDSMIQVFRTLIGENLEIWTEEFKQEIVDIAKEMVELEFKFIDLAFEQGGIVGLTSDEVKEYVRYLADRRLLQLGIEPVYGVKDHPLPWLAEMLNSTELANFFEIRSTEYSKGTLTGEWSDVFPI